MNESTKRIKYRMQNKTLNPVQSESPHSSIPFIEQFHSYHPQSHEQVWPVCSPWSLQKLWVLLLILNLFQKFNFCHFFMFNSIFTNDNKYES